MKSEKGYDDASGKFDQKRTGQSTARHDRQAADRAGGFEGAYYSHAIEVEVYVEQGDAAFDALLGEIGTVLDADPTLGGFAFGMTYGRPDVDAEGVAGAPAIKAGTIIVTVEYETESPLG